MRVRMGFLDIQSLDFVWRRCKDLMRPLKNITFSILKLVLTDPWTDNRNLVIFAVLLPKVDIWILIPKWLLVCVWKSLSLVCLFATPWTIYSLPDSSVHGILQARILEWGAIPFSRGSSRPRDQTQVSRIAGGFFTIWVTREARMTV